MRRPGGQGGILRRWLVVVFFPALIVYFSHIGTPESLPTVFRTFSASGYIGVPLFFVLSGFVLSWNYFDRLRRPTGAGLARYFIARFGRIYPLYVAVLAYIALDNLRIGVSNEGIILLPRRGTQMCTSRSGSTVPRGRFLWNCFVSVRLLSRDRHRAGKRKAHRDHRDHDGADHGVRRRARMVVPYHGPR